MGSIRTWSLAAVAGVMVVVVAHQRSSAQSPPARGTDAEQAVPAARPLAKVTGLPDFSDLVAENGASVVNISVLEKALKLGPGADPRAGDPLSQFFHRYQMPEPEHMPPAHGIGSGFIITSDGYILTNAHVVADAQTLTVKLTDRREFSAKVIGVDRHSDVALIKIDATGLPAVHFGDPSHIRAGQWVIAIGSPFGYENSVTAGVISGTARTLPDENYVPFIQTDAAVNPGNSGGPLFNLNGEVIGINSQIFSRTGGFMGMSFAIPIDLALNVKEQLLRTGKVSRSRIGVAVQEVNQQLAHTFGLTRPHGALISAVEPKSPGEKSGMKPGDVITSVNGREIEHSSDLPSIIAVLPPGSEAHIGLWHDHKATTMNVRTVLLDDEPAQAAKTESDDDGGKLGLAVRPLDADEQHELRTRGRLVVEDVTGPALAAGVQSGDVLLGVNGTAINTVAELKREVARAGHSVALLIQREDAQIYLPVDMG
jgi:serine protease Do